MSEIYLSKLAGSNANWLSARQTLIAGNVANSSTPGYKSVDVKPFSEAMKSTGLTASRTHSMHLTSSSGSAGGVGTQLEESWETYHSGANVSLPQEMIKSGEVSTAYQLNTSVMKSFHRMVVSAFGT